MWNICFVYNASHISRDGHMICLGLLSPSEPSLDDLPGYGGIRWKMQILKFFSFFSFDTLVNLTPIWQRSLKSDLNNDKLNVRHRAVMSTCIPMYSPMVYATGEGGGGQTIMKEMKGSMLNVLYISNILRSKQNMSISREESQAARGNPLYLTSFGQLCDSYKILSCLNRFSNPLFFVTA